jgi:hypothetical protein
MPLKLGAGGGGASPALAISDVLMSAVGAHKSWSILCTANQGAAYASIRELQFRTSLGGSHEAGGTPFASSELAGYEATKAYDGNTGTAWASGGGAMPQRVGCHYASPVEIIQTAITGFFDTGQGLVDYKVQYSDDDGETWFDTGVSITGQTWSSSSEVKTHNMLPAVSGNITESISVSNWRAIIADAATGALVGQGTFSGSSFLIESSIYSAAVVVTVLPANESDYGAAIAAYGPVSPS